MGSAYRFNVLFVVRVCIYRDPFANDGRYVRSPVGRGAGLVVLGLFPYFRIFFYQLVKELNGDPAARNRWWGGEGGAYFRGTFVVYIRAGRREFRRREQDLSGLHLPGVW